MVSMEGAGIRSMHVLSTGKVVGKAAMGGCPRRVPFTKAMGEVPKPVS